MTKKVVLELSIEDWKKLRAQAKANKRATSREAQHIIEDRIQQIKAEREAVHA